MSNVAPAVALPTVEGFVIHRELGHGGMGNVYLARRTGSTGWVALKTVTASGEPVARAHARFSREIAAVSRIDHPNVVRLLGHGGNDGAPYALFEHVDGCDLGLYPQPAALAGRGPPRAPAGAGDRRRPRRRPHPSRHQASQRDGLAHVPAHIDRLRAGEAGRR
jgi:hypothetical protein